MGEIIAAFAAINGDNDNGESVAGERTEVRAGVAGTINAGAPPAIVGTTTRI